MALEPAHLQRNVAALPEIFVVGNLLTDVVIHGVRRLPEWGREVEGTAHATVSSGQAALFAQALARLGMRVRVVGNVGDDRAGRDILSDLTTAEVDVSGVEISPGPTGLSVALVRPDGERAFVSDFAVLRAFDEATLHRYWQQLVSSRIVCVVGLLNLPSLSLDAVARLFAQAKSEGQTTMLDTGWDPAQWPPERIRAVRSLLATVDFFLPNLDEAAALTGRADAEYAADVLLGDGARVVAIKCGADGSYACDRSGSARVGALDVPIHDAVGAGDVFDAGFLSSYLVTTDLSSAASFASATAGLYVARATNRFPTLEEVCEAVPRIPSYRHVAEEGTASLPHQERV